MYTKTEKLKNRPQNNPKNNPRYFESIKENIVKRRRSKKLQQWLNPTFCRNCNKELPHYQYGNKFCGRSCAAIEQNKTRDPNTYIKQVKTLKKNMRAKGFVFTSVGERFIEYTPIAVCSVCKKFHAIRGRSIPKYCDTCKLETIQTYRKLCKFKLNPRDHHQLYDWELIKMKGFYQPATAKNPNPDGVTWDHLYRVVDGFTNKIPPEIISHPANASMITMTENRNTKGASKITLEELYERIRKWDED